MKTIITRNQFKTFIISVVSIISIISLCCSITAFIIVLKYVVFN